MNPWQIDIWCIAIYINSSYLFHIIPCISQWKKNIHYVHRIKINHIISYWSVSKMGIYHSFITLRDHYIPSNFDVNTLSMLLLQNAHAILYNNDLKWEVIIIWQYLRAKSIFNLSFIKFPIYLLRATTNDWNQLIEKLFDVYYDGNIYRCADAERRQSTGSKIKIGLITKNINALF